MPALAPFQSGQRLHLTPAPAIQRVSSRPTIRLYTFRTISTGKGIRSKLVLGNWTPERTEIRPGLWRRKTGHPHPSAAELKGPANEAFRSPPETDGVTKRNCAEAKPACALTSYGAVRLALHPCSPPADRVLGRRRIKI